MPVVPYEMMAGPADIFTAPVGESFPDIDSSPVGNWISLGRTEGGVTITHDESIEILRVDQATGPIKALRTEESLTIEFGLAEVTLERYATVLNNIAVTTDTSPAIKIIKPRLGVDVNRIALLIKGPSPYGDFNMQYEVPIVVQMGAPSLQYTKEDKTVLEAEFTAIEDPDAGTPEERFGRIVAQTA